jgi:16S rRNA (uracil1498-N3)-methyltransferase
MERMHSILESALIQSQQVWLPLLHPPQPLIPWMERVQADQKFIAHCEPGAKRKLTDILDKNLHSQLILIGPEGDFSDGEIGVAMQAGFVAVTLGENRLRSETAAVAAAAVLKLF